MAASTPTRLLAAAAAALLFGAATAIPAVPAAVTPVLELRAEATDAWVTVDKSGTPTTVTPVVTVSDGTATTVSAIPNDLTATVRTMTQYGQLTTSSGTTAAAPTATNKAGAGSFLKCSNTDGEFAPFCEPTSSDTLYVGTTYYVTWDSSVINTTKVEVTGNYINATTGVEADQVFSSDDTKTSRSFYAWTPSGSLLKKGNGKAVNITLYIKTLDTDEETVISTYTGPTILVSKTPTYHQKSPTLPKGAELYIALPVVFGFCLLMICGVCMWNRKTRKIGLGNIMSRGRQGYGIAKSRAKRMTRTMRSDKKQDIRLMDNLPEEQMYRDEPREHHSDGLRVGRARRDSDALGSLAGTPTSGNFPADSGHQQQGGNVFRDEMERQRRERF